MPFTVIKLGGCNGSGKTSLARALIDLTVKPINTINVELPSGKVTKVYLGRYENAPIVILGKYDTACGGMDTISDKDDRLWLLKVYCKADNIVFYEGLITGKTYGAMGALSEEHVKRKRGRWLYTFMDTPFDVCVTRTEERRRAAGNLAPLDATRTLEPTFKSCQHLAEKLRGTRKAKVGPQPYPHPVHMVNHKLKPATAAKQLLKVALEMHNAK